MNLTFNTMIEIRLAFSARRSALFGFWREAYDAETGCGSYTATWADKIQSLNDAEAEFDAQTEPLAFVQEVL
jgi:hypothetical protein